MSICTKMPKTLNEAEKESKTAKWKLIESTHHSATGHKIGGLISKMSYRGKILQTRFLAFVNRDFVIGFGGNGEEVAGPTHTVAITTVTKPRLLPTKIRVLVHQDVVEMDPS